jgi:hypothetical protein
MSFFFKPKPRTPADLVRLSKDALIKMERDPEKKKVDWSWLRDSE